MSTTGLMSLSVKVIIHDLLGRVLLLQRAKTSKGNPGKWEFPGGKIDPGESFDAGLVREVREEAGLTIQLTDSYGTCESEVAGRKVVYLVMEGASPTADVRLSDEHDSFKWVAPEKFGEVEFSSQFRRIANRYAQDAAINPRVPKQPKQEGPEDLFKDSVVNPVNLKMQLDEFKIAESDRASFKKVLEEFLSTEIKRQFPMAQVGARAKDLVSFARKLIQKNKYKEPLRQVTDLIGARIVVHLPSEVDVVGQWIEKTFEVDRANSIDKLKDLGADKFGYRSVHYVVVLRNNQPVGLQVPPKLEGLKAEIQVRTIAQHAWSDIGHDRIYRADCDIPGYWKREANRIAALLEAADEEFARLVKGLDSYRNHMRVCPDSQTAERQLHLWETVRKASKQDPSVALRVAHLAERFRYWKRIITVVDECGSQADVHLLCAKGKALCQLAANPYSPEWKDGIGVLTTAAERHPNSLEPRFHLGELLMPLDRGKALQYYSQAFQLDSSNPAVLAGYVRCKVLEQHDIAFLPLLRPDIEEAIGRCRDLVAAGADIPDALYRITGFLLLLGSERGQEALEVLARAVHETPHPVVLIRALRDFSALAGFLPTRVDIKCAVRFLAAALKARFPHETWPEDIPVPAAKPLDTPQPVIIVAGGCHASHESAMREYGDLLWRALGAFRGTIISGGTTQGISGLVGALKDKSGGRIHPVGYLPMQLPSDGSATPDGGYKIRSTDGESGFTALEPLQGWLDLLAAGVTPKQVRLLGINGGNLAGLEYRIALALGAQVGIIRDSGREADRLLKEWLPASSASYPCAAPEATRTAAAPSSPPEGRLLALPPDPMTLRAFVFMGMTTESKLDKEAILQAARLTHEEFLEERRYGHSDPVMQPWPRLRKDLQQSNINQIRYLESILMASGFAIRKRTGAASDPRFETGEISCMAEMEHGRWIVERLAVGWKYGPVKNAEKMISPWLVTWEVLPKKIQEYDLQNVRLWPQRLAEVGYEIYRVPRIATTLGSSPKGRKSRRPGRRHAHERP